MNLKWELKVNFTHTVLVNGVLLMNLKWELKDYERVPSEVLLKIVPMNLKWELKDVIFKDDVSPISNIDESQMRIERINACLSPMPSFSFDESQMRIESHKSKKNLE